MIFTLAAVLNRFQILLATALLTVVAGCSRQPPATVVASKLFTDHPGMLRGNFTGSVGAAFIVDADQDVFVTHVGFFDAYEDGLQIEHRVALLEADKTSTDVKLLTEVTIPWGKAAPLDSGYRWVQLKTPLTLKADHRYVLNAEVESGVMDPWPDRVLPRTVAVADESQTREAQPKWNEYFVGTQPPATRVPRWSRKKWPAEPKEEKLEVANCGFGAANLGFHPPAFAR